MTRAEVVERLGIIGKTRASVGYAWLYAHDRALLRDAIRHYGTMREACAAAGVASPPRGRRVRWNWSPEVVIKKLRERATSGEYKLGHALTSAVCRAFGSVAAARRAAGIARPTHTTRRRKWSRELVITELRALATRGEHKLGRSLTVQCGRRFGSVAAAWEAAGVARPKRRWLRRWSAESLRAELRARVARGDVSLDDGLGDVCRYYFGSIAAAWQAAGAVQSAPMPRRRKWSAELVRAELRAYAARGEFRLDSAALNAACAWYFGSIAAAWAAVGVARQAPTTPRRKWSAELVADELRAHAARGEYRLDVPLKRACVAYYGSLGAAWLAAGVAYVPRGRWSKAMVTELLRERAALGAVTLDRRNARDRPILAACWRYYGSIAEAWRAVGVEVVAKHRTWTREIVVERLRERAASGELKLDRSLALACRYYFGGVVAAWEAAGVNRWRARKGWSAFAIVKKLHALAARGVFVLDADLAGACRAEFGSVAVAWQAAGIDRRARLQAA